MKQDSANQSNEQTNGPDIEGWGKVGGAVGFIIIFLMFGVSNGDVSTGAGSVMSGFLKGAIGGGIGAAAFSGLAVLFHTVKGKK